MADYLFEEAIQIADDGRNDTTTDDDGHVVVNHDIVNRSKLRVDTRKWACSKLLPRKYGESIAVEHSGEITSTLREITAAERQERVRARLVRRGELPASIPREAAQGGAN
jgi:hypothetical protein